MNCNIQAARTLCLVLIPAFSLIGQARADENLFPAKLGSVWTFKGNAGAVNVAMDATIASSKTDGKKTTVVMRWTKEGAPVQDETYVITSESVSRSRVGAYGNIKMDPPFPIIQYPVKINKIWKWSGTVITPAGSNKAAAIIKVISKENIKTHAGMYSAFRIESMVTFNIKGQSVKVPNIYWFAPDVGMVQQRMLVPQPDGKGVVVEASVSAVKIKR